jgi:carbonic anhydrase/acetyltransferase-like protein (isoleucine patch superfamily)
MNEFFAKTPKLADDCWIAENATVSGDVTIGRETSIWFGAVMRGDTEAIRIGDASNIQDLCCLHGDPGFPCIIGDRVTVGHGAIVHGAIVESDCLIGIGAIILNGATISSGSIVAAGALVPEGKTIPPNSLVMGTPGKVIRETTEDDRSKIDRGTKHYVSLSRAYLKSQA